MEGNKASTDGLGGRITAAGCQQQGQQEVNGEALGGLATHGTAGLLLSPDEDTGSTAESRGDRQHRLLSHHVAAFRLRSPSEWSLTTTNHTKFAL